MRTITTKCESVYETRMFKTRSDPMPAIIDFAGLFAAEQKKDSGSAR